MGTKGSGRWSSLCRAACEETDPGSWAVLARGDDLHLRHPVTVMASDLSWECEFMLPILVASAYLPYGR